MAKAMDKLPQEIVDMLQKDTIVSLITSDAETGEPQLSVVSWVRATKDGSAVKIAVGHKGSTLTNLEKNPRVTLGTIGPDSCYEIKGEATVSDIIEGTMKFRVITVHVQSVEDVIFYGGKITVQPAFEKTYNPDLKKKLDDEVEQLLS